MVIFIRRARKKILKIRQKQETSPCAARERGDVAGRWKGRIDIVPGALTVVVTNYGVRFILSGQTLRALATDISIVMDCD